MLRFEGTKAVQKVQNLDLLIKTLVAFEKLIHYNNCRIFFFNQVADFELHL